MRKRVTKDKKQKFSKSQTDPQNRNESDKSALSGVVGEIPKQLQNPAFKFVLLKAKDKVPFEFEWQKKNNYIYSDPKLSKHIRAGGNFGIIGGFGKLRIIDVDDLNRVAEMYEKLPATFTVRTGSGGLHFYYISDYETNHVFNDNLGEFRAKSYQVVCPSCIHPNGKKYEIFKDVPIRTLKKEYLQKLIKPFLRDSTTSSSIKTENKDTSRSAKEYREVIKLIGQGKTKQEVYKEMAAFAKWSSAPEQYKELTYSKALGFVEAQHSDEEKVITPEIEATLKEPTLFNNIIGEFKKTIEGETRSVKAIFLSLCSIWNKGNSVPLNTLVSSESSAGKSYICKNVIKIFPKNLIEYRTKITPEAFTYWKAEDKNWNWDGKICYLEDISQSILDSPTFKVMCSEGSTATVVIKQKTVDLHISGKPVMLITTARTTPNVEILNRFQIVSVDESAKQTEDIVFRIAKDEKSEPYDKSITEALGILKRVEVKINFGEQIALYIKSKYNFKSLRLRRDFSRLISLIKCSAALHQFQREVDEMGTVEATEEDYAIARECINYVQTATFKGLTHRLKKAFSACKDLNEFTAKQIHSKYPFMNQKSWYTKLDQLLERGMLYTELRKEEEVKQQITYYKVKHESSFELPEFEYLPQKLTKDTNDTKETKATKVTKVRKKGKNNCNNCNNFTGKASKKLDLYEAIKQLDKGEGASLEDCQELMACSNKDFLDYLNFAKEIGRVEEFRSGLLRLAEG